ncbi:APC family permease [Sinanaerobacter chloroacetimidivorans]|uniref:APC family permease n=1 Tax=Sinanaerobacter chloroacetimidivorans TaxID=2818044 RepID=A0A8J7W349_9FIRM|nr:APC family permease [Sinanaerobacter chloroacetimidivorans]MBR0599614.1 APC family permease [Sinanaerobacter chloroacetimidivorans]
MTTNTENMGYTQELKRVLTLKDLAIYGIAFMTPIAPAYIYGSASAITGGTLALAYIIAMVAMLFTAYSYGHMAAAFPIAGSTYSYTQRAINHHLGFFAGWAMFLDYVLVPLVVFMVGASYANAAVPSVPYVAWVFIIAAVVTVVNYFGVQMAARTNLILVGIMGAIVIVFIVVCAFAVTKGTGEGTLISARPFYNPDGLTSGMLIAGGAIACFSFLGFDSITTMAEEAVNPRKDIGRAAIIACILGGGIFILQAYMAQLVWPDYTAFETADTALFEVAQLAGGAAMAGLYTFAVILSTLTAGLTGQSSAARLLYGMGRDEVLPKKFFTHLHPKYKTPVYNIFIMCTIGVIGALTMNISLVAELLNFGGLFGFMCVNLSVIVYYYFKQKQKKVLQYFLLPALGFVICFYLWIHLSTIALTVGGSWLAIGIIYAAIETKGFKKKPPVLSE